MEQSAQEVESSVVRLPLPSGGFLVCVTAKPTPEAETLAPLSRGAMLVSRFVKQTLMCSATFAWRVGRLNWSGSHDGTEGPSHVVAVGTTPEELDPLLAALRATPSGVSELDPGFGVPVDLFEVLSGDRHARHVGRTGAADGHLLARR